MLNDINEWRLRIGIFAARKSKCNAHCRIKSNNRPILILMMISIYYLITLFLLQYHFIYFSHSVKTTFLSSDILLSASLQYFLLSFLLLLSGDIEVQPGPVDKNKLSICHWNLNGLVVHNFIKLSSLQAFNTMHKFDVICISETFLNSSISSDNPSLALNGYKLIRRDHPLDLKRGGICIYYKESLPIKFLNISNLSECLICEIIYGNKKCYIVSLYRSPSQNNEEFENFMNKFENIIDKISTPGNPNLIFIVGDFNAKLSTWNPVDVDTFEGIELGNLTSSYGLSQIISDPTHILPNSSTCIDLIFTNQPNMVTKSGVYSSLHPNCHHQITYACINFKIFFPPPYERKIWHYGNANIESIRSSLNNIDWDRLFTNTNVNKQVEIFNNCLTNVINNYIPNKTITIDDKDPPWLTSQIKNKINFKNDLYKNFLRNGRSHDDFYKIREACNSVNQSIIESKNAYYNRLSRKLNNPKTSSKAYWSILKSFFCDKKIPVIPPLFINNEFITNFKAKADIFNNYFSNQCSLLINSSTLPNTNIFPQNHSFSSINIDENKILKLIRSLDINKSHGHDNISARMLKLCDNSIVKPLMLIFNNCLVEENFPIHWKKANITPIHKKGDRNNVENYRPISVLPLCGKLFEKIIYDDLYKYLETNSILNINQSGFRAGDSCINQLISITHEIFNSFDTNPTLEVRGLFLDISKAFDKVWHEGIIFKLKSNGVEGKILNLLKSFLDKREQRVVLNGECSTWSNIKAGVPQGSILGPLLFLIYINDISQNLESNVKLFADDTSLFSTVYDPNISAQTLNRDLEKIQQWAYQWKMSFNPDPSKQAHEVIFSKKHSKSNHPYLFFNQQQVLKVSNQKHLGMILDEKLNFNHHIKIITDKVNKSINILRKLRYYVPRQSLITMYKSFIRPHLEYGDVIYDQPNNEAFSAKIESIQYNAALAITGSIRGSSKEKLYKELGIESLSSRRWFRRLCLFYKIVKTKSPSYLYDIIPKPHHNINTRIQHHIPQFFCRTNAFSNSFFPSSIKNWNETDYIITQSKSFTSFRNSLLKMIRPIPNSIFDACDPVGIQLLTRLRLGLSHLRHHKFRHNFNDTLDPLCPCNNELETVSHFYLQCHFFNNERTDLMNELQKINVIITNYDQASLTNLLLYGTNILSDEINTKILNLSINYIVTTKRFEGPLF